MESILCSEIKVIELAKYDIILTQPRQAFFNTADNLHISIREESVCYMNEAGCCDLSRGVELQREVCIKSDIITSAEALFVTFQELEKLLMLYRGNFLKIQSMEFFDKKGQKCIGSEQVEQLYISHRLKYFESRDLFQGSKGALCEFDHLLNDHIFTKWNRLLNKLEIVHQVFLYNTADTGLPVEIALAFLIQIFEPLYEYLSMVKAQIFPSKKEAKTGSKEVELSLREELEKVINVYGNSIFKDELTGRKTKDAFLKLLVNSRVRIMHVKRKDDEPFLQGKEAVTYIGKISLLYRHILLQLIGIDFEVYKQNLVTRAQYYEQFLN